MGFGELGFGDLGFGKMVGNPTGALITLGECKAPHC